MIKILNEDKEYLKKYNIDIWDKVEKNELQEALDIIDDAIVDDIVDHDDEPSKHGIRLQRIYDRIRADNIDMF